MVTDGAISMLVIECAGRVKYSELEQLPQPVLVE
jgi:hypothetical protein